MCDEPHSPPALRSHPPSPPVEGTGMIRLMAIIFKKSINKINRPINRV